MLVAVRGVDALADQPDFQRIVQPAFSDAGVEHSGLVPRVGSNEKDGVGLLNTWDGGVEEVVGANVDAVGGREVSVGLVESEVV
ncbi:hypothetical protein LshimejAT787_0700470 [Lyophyllum shimeji]|uniref:Uncharacterized protein n=1 Tax=Lyophyllum shimeji TaxID=47721 RepID=A0A9P3UNP5_LYOSH|nr:hypothetical protein LshimejAT787_0700470 [Lyophyllum shimeji]